MQYSKQIAPYLLVFIAGIVSINGCTIEPETNTEKSSTNGYSSQSSKQNKIKKLTKEQIEKDKTKAQNFYIKGEEAESSKHLSKAIKLYSRAIDLNPNHLRARNKRALIYYQDLEYKKAIEDLKIVSSAKPSWVAQSDLMLSRSYIRIGKVDDALRLLKQTIPNLKDRDNKIKALRKLAKCFRTKENYTEALKSINQAIELSGKHGIIVSDRVQVYLAMDNFNKALDDLNYIVNEKAANEKVYFLRAKVFMKQKKYDDAIKDLNKIITPNTFNREHIKLRIEACNNAGKGSQAKADKKLLKEYDDFASPPESMGNSMNRARK